MIQISESANGEKGTEVPKQRCDILVNNFQIKKKRYRVLFNYDHIVWERLSAERKAPESNRKVNTIKETEIESDQYGNNSKIVHINEVIRVYKGDTKSMTFRLDLSKAEWTECRQTNPNDQSSVTITPTAQYLTIHFAERIIKSETDCNRWHVRILTLYNTDPYIVAQWHMLLNKKIHENPIRLQIRRLLVFINPYGGRKKGFEIYERHCKPIFQLAGIDVSCVISQRPNQMTDMIMSQDLKPYDAICCVGGDGTAAEIINGLIFRTMRDRKLDAKKPAYIPKPTIPIGIIPAGSTDTIAYSVHGTSDAQTAAIHLVLGQRRGCDICSIRNQHGIVRFCASVFSYGYLGDVAAHSEKYRWMGPKRYEYTGVKTFLANRSYEAEVRLLESVENDSGVDIEAPCICRAHCQRCSSIITQHTGDGDGDGDTIRLASPTKEHSECNTSYTNSDWTISTERSLDPENIPVNNISTTDNENASKDAASEEVVLRRANRNENSKINCDIPIKSDSSNCDDMAIQPPIEVNSRKSFSFCSTSITTQTNDYRNSNTFSNNELVLTSPATISTRLTTLTDELKWKVIRGHFFMISCANITCACSRSPNGISRYNHLGDGHLDVILVRKTSILNNLRFALNTMGRNGDIRNLPFVETYRTRQFHFRAHNTYAENDESMRASTQPIADACPDDVSDKSISSWNCDGEIVHDLDVTMTSHCQLIDVFMRGPYSYNKAMNENGTKTRCFCIPKH